MLLLRLNHVDLFSHSFFVCVCVCMFLSQLTLPDRHHNSPLAEMMGEGWLLESSEVCGRTALESSELGVMFLIVPMQAGVGL